MNPSDLTRGFWTICDNRFITLHQTLQDAKEHIKFQTEVMHSKGNWSIVHIKDYEFIK